MTYEVIVEGRTYRLELDYKDGTWICAVDGREVRVEAVQVRFNVLSLIIGSVSGSVSESASGGASYEVKLEPTPSATYVWIGTRRYEAEVRDPRSLRSRRAPGGEAEGAKKVVAPMPGKVVRILVRDHDAVGAGQGVVVVEAMKMQNELKSPKQGSVQKILVAEGASVNAGDVLLVIE